MSPAIVSPGPLSAPTNSSTASTTKSKEAITRKKRPLAEKTDNETNSALTKKKLVARKVAEPKAHKRAAIPTEVVVMEDENIEEDGSSSLSKSSGSTESTRAEIGLRPEP